LLSDWVTGNNTKNQIIPNSPNNRISTAGNKKGSSIKRTFFTNNINPKLAVGEGFEPPRSG